VEAVDVDRKIAVEAGQFVCAHCHPQRSSARQRCVDDGRSSPPVGCRNCASANALRSYGDDMRWTIGLDLGDRSGGALALASWLRSSSLAPAVQEFVAVHAIDEEVRRLLRTGLLDELIAHAQRDLDELVTRSEIAPAVIQRSVVTADSPERAIADVATAACDAILIGRIAPHDGRQLVRLGRVARRLLRRLPKPVVVAPPDLSLATLGRGPLLLATDLRTASAAAAAFAGRLANELGRKLLVVHVDPIVDVVPTFWGDPIVVDLPRRIPADVDAWAQNVGLGGARTHLAAGPLVENVLDIARVEDSPMIICGSRGLGTFDRIFVSSSSIDLARLADRPVAVVPAE
jgi:nucleotide-binding universal stress UspA family protein